MKNLSFILILTLISHFGYNQDSSYCETNLSSTSDPHIGGECSDYSNYSPANSLITPIKTIRLSIHIMQKDDGTGNIENIPSHLIFLAEIQNQMNNHYANLGVLDVGTSIHILDSRIRVVFEKLYFHAHTADYLLEDTDGDFIDFVTNDVDSYGLTADDKFNTEHIFVYGNAFAILGGQTYGILGYQGYIRERGWYKEYYANGIPGAENCAKNLIHELGHRFGLSHNYYTTTPTALCDACSDNDDAFGVCPLLGTSNNFMDSYPAGYSTLSPSFSECQLSKIHFNLSGGYGTVVQIVKRDYCALNSALDMVLPAGVYLFNSNSHLYGNLILEPGAILTIKCNLHFPEGAFLKVKPGAKLIVDQGRIYNDCGSYWQGIEAIGNPLSSFQIPSNHAMVVLNDATIENAYVAIRGGEVDPTYITKFNQGGAIVQVKNSTFKNNWINVQMTPYKRFYILPSGAKIEQNNLSYFTNNTFINDAPLTNPAHTNPNVGVSIWGVRGIQLKGNTFENSRTDILADKKGVGISLVDATNTIVSSYCSSLIFPCPTGFEDQNEFKKLYIGIETLLGTGADNLTVSKNHFQECVYQIKSSGSAYLKVTENKFEIPFGTFSFPGFSDAFGIFMSGVYGFNIEGNSFFPLHNGGSGQSLGVLANNTSTVLLGNKIFRNDFGDLNELDLNKRGLSIGTQTAGNNSTLDIDCNRFYRSYFTSTTPTKLDIHIAKGSIADQGICHPTFPTFPQANEFYGTSTTCSMVFNNAQIWKNFLTTGPSLISPPLYNSYSNVGFNDGCNNWGLYSNDCLGNELSPYDREASCPPTLPGTSTSTTFTKALTDYDFYKSEIESLSAQIDGGNTQALVDYINTHNVNWQLRDHLMSFAPYLSDEVLLSLVKKNTPAPAPWVINEVLIACAPPTETVLKALLNRTPSLAPSIIRDFFVASAPVHKDVMIALINKSGIPPWVIQEVAIANSPMFSEELVAIINRIPKLSPSVLNEILLKNTPLTQPVLDALNNRTPALPQWVWNNINSSTYETPHPDTRIKIYNPVQQINNSISYANTEKLYNLSWLVSHYLDSNYVDSALGILYDDGSIEAMCALVPVRIDRGQIPEADLILTFIYNRAIYRQNLDLDDPVARDLLNFCLFHNTIKTVQGNPQGYFSLTLSQKLDLENVANSESPTSANARAVLNFINDVHPYEPAYPVDEELNPRSLMQKQNAQPISEINLHCYPNPSGGNVAVEISGLNEAPNGYLVVVDITGKIIRTINIRDEYNSISINDLGSGLYQLIFYQTEIAVASEKLIIIK
jgi:predicted Zn-dependent protease